MVIIVIGYDDRVELFVIWVNILFKLDFFVIINIFGIVIIGINLLYLFCLYEVLFIGKLINLLLLLFLLL